jgi:protein TonB
MSTLAVGGDSLGGRARGGAAIGRSLVVSTVLHVAAVLAVVLWPTAEPPARPPVYRVSLIGAPTGPKAIGVVDPTPVAEPVRRADAPSGIERKPEEIVAPTPSRTPPKPVPTATPTPSRTTQAGQADGAPRTAATSAPRAGSATGGRGADVVTVKTDGIDFPAPGYLNNIVRQVEVRFTPPSRFENRPLRALVSFLIHRDGTVSDIRVEESSGEYAFDLEGRSSIESAGTARAFGALPAEWTDDVLRVYFNFTPKGMR